MTEAYRARENRDTGVGTLGVLSCVPLSLASHSTSSPTLPPVQPPGSSRRRAKTQWRLDALTQKPTIRFAQQRLLSLESSPSRFYIHVYMHETVHARGYLYKKTDEGLCRRPSKKTERRGRGSVKTRDVVWDR